MTDLLHMVDTEEQYRALLDKLIRLRNTTAGYRDSYALRAQDMQMPPRIRSGCGAKARVLSTQIAQLDFILSKNRKQIEAFGLVMPAPATTASTS